MIRPKIAVQTASLRQPLKKAINTAAALGAEAIEIDARTELPPGRLSQTGLRQLRKLLSDLNLRVAAVDFYTRRGYDVLDDLDRRVAATREAMQFAARLGAAVVVNHIGPVPEDREGQAWRTMVEVLTDLGLYGSRCGARLCAVTGGEPGTQLAELFRAVPDGTVAVTLDPGRLWANGFSVEETVAALGQSIAHVHATDAAKDANAGRGLEVLLGRGAVDYPALLGSLEELGYRGALSVVRPGASDAIAEIGQGVRYLKSL